jgi:hypothetical protein
MATENDLFTVSYGAAEDLSNDQYRFVVLNSSEQVRRPDAIGEDILGVLQTAEADAQGKPAAIMLDGITKIEAGEALAIGDKVGAEFISPADAGKAIKTGVALKDVRGIVIQAADAEGDLASILLVKSTGAGGLVQFTVELPAGTANTTVRTPILAVLRAMRITKIGVSAATIPIDADGTLLLAILNYDDSGTAEDALLAASFNLEDLATAKTSELLTLTATAADLILALGDTIYADIISNSAAIDTPMVDAVLTIEAELLSA